MTCNLRHPMGLRYPVSSFTCTVSICVYVIFYVYYLHACVRFSYVYIVFICLLHCLVLSQFVCMSSFVCTVFMCVYGFHMCILSLSVSCTALSCFNLLKQDKANYVFFVRYCLLFLYVFFVRYCLLFLCTVFICVYALHVCIRSTFGYIVFTVFWHCLIQSAPEASWRWAFDPYNTLELDLYH